MNRGRWWDACAAGQERRKRRRAWRKKKLGKADKVSEKIAGKRQRETKPRPSYRTTR